jgi:hypothetical protein
VLASIVHPIVDLRDFSDGPPRRLPRPAWPQPEQREFVRALGPIVPRKSGGVPVYGDEDRVCDAAHAIRFDAFAHAPFERFVERPRIKCPYRRFFHNGAGAAKFEIGFALKCRDPIAIAPVEAPLFLTEIALLRAHVIGGQPHPLVKLGGDLAAAYLRDSSPRFDDDPQRCVVYGEPLLFVHARRDREKIGPPDGARAIDFASESGRADAISLYHYWLTVGHLRVRTWLLLYDDDGVDHEVRKTARYLRVMLTRIHVERQFLAHVLRRIDQGALAPSPGTPAQAALRSALDRSFKRLKQSRRSGLQRSTGDLYALSLGAEDAAVPGESA